MPCMTNTKKHILVVTQYYYPEPFRINDMTAEWVKRGYKVTVLTGIPNYPEGEFYDGYGHGKNMRETVNGVDIIRVPIIARGHSALKLMMNYASFMFSAGRWFRKTDIKPDSIFIFEVSPMTQALPPVKFAGRKKIPCTIYVQDLWPENLEAVAGIHNKLIIRAVNKMVDRIYRGCTHIMATSPSFKSRLELRKSVWDAGGNSKVIYWPQYAEEFYVPTEKMILEDMPCDNRFKLIFTGNVGFAQGLDILPRVYTEIKAGDRECDFVIIGDGRYMDKLKAEVNAAGAADYFFFPGRKPAEDIPKYLGACDAAFISFADNELFNMTIPAKLQSYMACGMPILAAAGGETARIVTGANAGLCSPVGDVKGLAQNLIKLMDTDLTDMRKASGEYAGRFFDKNKLMNEIEEII